MIPSHFKTTKISHNSMSFHLQLPINDRDGFEKFISPLPGIETVYAISRYSFTLLKGHLFKWEDIEPLLVLSLSVWFLQPFVKT